MKGYELSYYSPVKMANELVAYFPNEALDVADPVWAKCLVGYFVGKKLPFQLVETALKHAWGAKLIEVKVDEHGFFFFRIPDAEYRRRLLDSGPITVARVPLILQQWDPCLELKNGDRSKIPMWVRLRNIPLVLWLSKGISGIASMIGRPLYVDQNTKQMKLLSYARVCVELLATDARQDTIKVYFKDITREVSVEYEWRPIVCSRCGTFGHRCSPTENPPAQSQHTNTEEVRTEQAGEEPIQAQTLYQRLDHTRNTSGESGTSALPAENAGQCQVQTAAKQLAKRKTRMVEHGQKMVNPITSSPGPHNLNWLSYPLRVEEAIRQLDGSTDDLDVADDLDETDAGGSFEDKPSELDPLKADASLKSGGALGLNASNFPSVVPDSQPTQHAAVLPVTAQAKPSTKQKSPPQKMMVGKRRARGSEEFCANDICCLGLIETKVPHCCFVSISTSLLPGWHWLANYDFSVRARIWIGWNPTFVDFSIIFVSSPMIHGMIKVLSSGATLHYSAIYGEHTFIARRPLWMDLVQLSSSLSDSPWIVGGDFNAIWDPSDRQGSPDIWHPSFDEFKECLMQVELEDLKYVGFRFTWSSYSCDNRKQRKIDCVLVNNKWSLDYSFSEASFLPPGISDHTPILIRILAHRQWKKPFKFFNLWMSYLDFTTTVS
ncbi:hypothetical protein BT93_B1105 [Corymbia citriodora subsp. variegata]|nr:hypothetical protein BT93_B1105 [Corymbia citriodora subsp. variegata]